MPATSKNIQVIGCQLYFIPVQTRVPLKFGKETLTSVTCARVRITVRTGDGTTAVGWGETPLSITWIWPSEISYEERFEKVSMFTKELAREWVKNVAVGHPMELGYSFINKQLKRILDKTNSTLPANRSIPYLAALVCNSAFDIAIHDAYGNIHGVPVYETYNKNYMNLDLSSYLKPANGSGVDFKGKYPIDFLIKPESTRLPVWHLVGGLDILDKDELTGNEPDDGYPVTLVDWIRRDGLKNLKIKLRGNDAEWDDQRLVRVGNIAISHKVNWLTTDFNCTVTDPCYVNNILDNLMKNHPRIYSMILYVEQPFPYDLEENRIDVRSVSSRKPLFMDESAHDWRLIKLGRSLGWTGVALKTCKTQTGAILSACWAKAHGMTLMVQDLTNPMLAQIPHVLLAAHAGTIMGVETNGMQFYPQASRAEEKVHPGLYRRRNGMIDFKTLDSTGFGYRTDKIVRELPEPVAVFGKWANLT